MRDKFARRRLLFLEAKLDRVEATLDQIQYALSSTMNQSIDGNIQCGKCNTILHDGFVCGDNACPHGLDADIDEAE